MPSTQKIILITGGSRGIGAAVARLAAQRGYAVGINYHKNEGNALALAQEITRKGGTAITFKADISQESEVMQMFNTLDQTFGRLDALVNNAGIIGTLSPLSGLDATRIRHIFEVNVLGSILCAREAARRMSTESGGAGGGIVNVSSGASKTGSPFEYLDYAASKGAIDTFTIGLAKELAPVGIRVNAVRPGFVDTEIHAPGRLERVVPLVPMGRAGRAEEIAETILWVLSENASYVCGALLDVAGGR